MDAPQKSRIWLHRGYVVIDLQHYSKALAEAEKAHEQFFWNPDAETWLLIPSEWGLLRLHRLIERDANFEVSEEVQSILQKLGLDSTPRL